MKRYEEFKIMLEAALLGITEELNNIAVFNKKSGDWEAIPDGAEAGGDADANVEADFVEDWNERRAIVSQLEIRHRNITRALQKIADSTYGVCEISGEPIEEERLRANPAARTNMANIDREKELSI